MSTAQIFTPAVGEGDATGEHTLHLWRALSQRFDRVDILCNFAPGALPDDIAPSVQQVSDSLRAQADLSIVQYPLWYPLAERIRDTAGHKLFWYHGVTPPELWGSERDVELLRNSQIRTALAWHTHLAAVTSPYTGQELVALSGLPVARLRTVPLGLDLSRFATPVDEDALTALRERWGLDGRNVVLFVGRIAGNKRIDLLIDAMVRLRQSHPAASLLVVGDGAYSEAARGLLGQLEQQVEAAGLTDRVIFTGRVDDLAPYYQMADLFVLPSEHEGFGIPLAEAMSAGTPVIAGASGAMPWVVGEGDGAAGLLFAAGDGAELASQMARMLDDDDLRARSIANGYARATSLGLDAFNVNTLALVDEVMAMDETDTAFNAGVGWSLYPQADTMLRDYAVRSNAPVVGPAIETVRRHLTSHLKEPYIDPVFERQVHYNRLLSTEVEYLHAELRRLEERLAALAARGHAQDGGPGDG